MANSKYFDLQSDYQKLQQKCHKYEQERYQPRVVQREDPVHRGNEMEYFNNKILIQKKDEEMIWLKSQLSAKDMQIQQLRNSELELIHQSKRNQQKINNYDQIESKYNRELTSHQETRRNIYNME